MKQKFVVYYVLLHIAILFGFSPTANAAPGDLDPSFSLDGKLVHGVEGTTTDQARATLIQPDGKILVAGTSYIGAMESFAIARYHPNGLLDTTFGAGGKQLVSVTSRSACDAIALQPDGKIVMVGYSRRGNGVVIDYAVVRLNPDGTPDASFDGDGMLSTDIFNEDYATGVKIQPDGKIVVSGYSGAPGTSAPDFSVVRYNTDGSLDTTFDGDGKVLTPVGPESDYAHDLAIQTDGKIVVTGRVVRGSLIATMTIGLVRYNADGSLDTTFDGDGKMELTVIGGSRATVIQIQPDGKYVLMGDTFSPDLANKYFAVVRLNPDGTFDDSFDGDGKATTPGAGFSDSDVSGVVQADGKIVVANYINGNAPPDIDIVIVRFNANGSLDTSFDGDGRVITDLDVRQNFAYGVAVQSDGKIVVVGKTQMSVVIADTDFLLIRYNSDGSIDNELNGGGIAKLNPGLGISEGKAVVMQSDGKIVIGGYARFSSTSYKVMLMRFNQNGTFDTSFDGDGIVLTEVSSSSGINALAIQPDGKIVAGGYAIQPSGQYTDFALMRYNTDGSLDTTFDGDGIAMTPVLAFNDIINDIVIQPDGKILAGGYSGTNPSTDFTDFSLARFNANGSLDTTFKNGGKFNYNLGADESIIEILLQPDGKIIIVGIYGSGSQGQFALIRFTTTGENDGSFGPNGGAIAINFGSPVRCTAAALQPDGRIVIAGDKSNSSPTSAHALARVLPNGTLDSTFDGDGMLTSTLGTYTTASSVVLQPNGKILVGGSIGGDVLLARYNSNGSLDTSYGTNGQKSFDWIDGTADVVNELILDSNGRAVMVGTASGITAVARTIGDSAIPNKAPFDFDGDGKTDISIYRPNGGEWWYLKSSDGGNGAVQFGNSTDRTVPADYTGDGKNDIAVYRPTTGEWFILRSENYSFYGFQFGANGDIAAPADYDGDGKTDPTVYRPSNGAWYSILSTDGSVSSRTFGLPNDKPVPADYDGDGKADIGIFRESSGQWWIQRSGGGITALEFGATGDRTVVGDYTGDGKADIAFWRPSNGTWYILRSEDSSFYGFNFGLANDKPVPGDYDGDGKMDAAVFRPSSSVWYQQRSSGGFQSFTFGTTNDQPVPNTYVR